MKLLRSVKLWAGGVLIGVDQLFNALTGGFADETFSSRMGVRRRNGDKGAAAACVVLDAIQENHCGMSIEEDADGAPEPHHLGHVIHEIPRDPATRLRKAGLILALFGFWVEAACASAPVNYCDRPDVLCMPSMHPTPKPYEYGPIFTDDRWPIECQWKRAADAQKEK